ncbi:MAG: choice-of-anchor F family protein [Pseudomonadota bacterium]
MDISVPQLTEWNEVNRLTVQPGIDGYTGASARTNIYSTEAARNAAESALTADPDAADIEDTLWSGSPAAVYWQLDDGSGRAPGIQVVTDDFDFPTNNCIMSSGERESADFAGVIVPKTCSDAPSSSKRYFLEIRDAGTPVDMVFDIGKKDIRYGGVKNPEDDGGEAVEDFREEYGFGRIYRVIQKVVNNSDERWAAINVEIGHGVGGSFQRFNYPADGVALELRELVPREFFEGETGAPDIEVWDPARYATFSPKAFDDGARDRFDPGFFDDEAAGFFPPQFVGESDKTSFILSGTDLREDGAYGAITANHFSMADEQAVGSSVTPGVFGYLLSDSLAPFSIARYDEGDPSGESDALEAWWDGTDWRYGLAGGEDGTAPFGVVSTNQLEQWAEKLLGIDPSQLGDAVRYGSILADDLATQNMDVYIYLDDNLLDETGEPKYDSVTLRVTGVPASTLGAVKGNDEPAWIDGNGDNTAPDLSSYMVADGVPVALNDRVTMFENFPASPYSEPGDETTNIDVLANDLLDGQLLVESGATINSVVVSGATNGSAILQGDNTVDFTPVEGFTGEATFNYTVEADSQVSNTATVTVQVDAYPDPDAPVAISDSGVTFINTPVTIRVLGNDVLPLGTPTVDILNSPLTGSAEVVNNEVIYTPAEDFLGLDRFTYTVTANGKVSNAAVITVRVDPVPDADLVTDDTDDVVSDDEGSSSDSGLFGCSYNPGGPFDPTLFLLTLAAIGGLLYRNRRIKA